jgi:protein-disulfide isomerase
LTRPSRRSVIAAAIGALALAGGAGAAPAAGDMALGDPKAKVTVVEYASASCSHCAAFHNEVFPAFKAKYVDTGKVRYVLREILTDPVDFAAAGFLTARCAGDDKYFAVLGELYASFPDLIRTGDARSALLRAGAAGGLDEAKVAACITDQAAMQALHTRVDAAGREGEIRATPTFFVNGRKVAEGPMTLAQLDAAIAAAAKAK